MTEYDGETVAQVPPDPRQRLTQRAVHLANRITTPPHRPNQSLLLDV